MASTFTLNSKSYDGRYLKVTCTQTINATTKKSTITWTMESIGGNDNYYITGATTLRIDGQQVYYKKRTSAHEFPCAKGAVSGSLIIEHTGAAGEKEIEVSISTAIYTSTVSTQKGTWTLDSIPNFVRIAYHPNGGTVGNTEKYGLNSSGYILKISDNTVWFYRFNYNESKDLHNASSFGLTRTGYTFAGWKIMNDGDILDQTTLYPSTIFTDTNDPTKNTSNSTDVRCRLRAQWRAHTYEVIYNANGGNGTTAKSTHTYGTAKTLTPNGYTRVGYQFKCWNTKADGSGTSYNDGASVSNLTATDASVTLYAIWELNFVRIAYHPNGGTVGNAQYGVNSSGYIYNTITNTPWLWTINYGVDDDVHNASSFGLTRTGYKFVGWKIMNDGQVIDQKTKYPSTIFTDISDPTKNTSNATDVRCCLQAQWQPVVGEINIDISTSLIDSTNSGWGLWLQNYCQARLTATATSQYGTIVSYKWNTGETTREIVTDILTEAGIYTWSVEVTNDLKQTETAEISIDVLPVEGDLFIPMLDNGTTWENLIPFCEDGRTWETLLPSMNLSGESNTTSVLGRAILGQMILGKVD